MCLPTIYKDQKGVAAVEFAIVLPLLALILFGTIDFALVFYNKQVITNASRELARYAIVADNGDVDTDFLQQKEYIKDFCNTKLVSLGGTSEVSDDDIDIDPNETPNYMVATIEFNYRHLFSGILNISETKLVGRTVMRNER